MNRIDVVDLRIEQIGPQTFYLQFVFSHLKYYFSIKNYEKDYQELVNQLYHQVSEFGLKPMIRTENWSIPKHYMTFRSKHDATAFKMKYM